MKAAGIPVAGGAQGAGSSGERVGKGSKGKALFTGQPGACEGLRVPAFLLHFAPAVCGSRAKVEPGGVERVPEEGSGRPRSQPLHCLGKRLHRSTSLRGSSLAQAEALSQAACPRHLCPPPTTPLAWPVQPRWDAKALGKDKRRLAAERPFVVCSSQRNKVKGSYLMEPQPCQSLLLSARDTCAIGKASGTQ